jgi:hypothetical protein
VLFRSGEIGEEDHGYLGEKFKDAVSRGYGSKLTKAHPFELDEYDAVNSITEKLFSESDIDKVLSKYFKTEKSQNTKIVSEIERLSESIDQELASKRIMKKLPNAKLLGKTKENFFKINFYKNSFQNYFNNFYDANSSLNYYFFDFPFLLAMKSDSSRYF